MAETLEDAPDEALLVAFANGDVQAGRALLDRLSPRLYAHAARILRDRAEAEDVVQETMLRLWRASADWQQGEARISTWAYRVATNLCTDRLRARARKPNVAMDQAPEPAAITPSVVDAMTNAERSAALAAALERLPARQRIAVSLRHLENLSNPEIAAIMEIGVEAVESLIARGKRRLVDELSGRKEELGFDDG